MPRSLLASFAFLVGAAVALVSGSGCTSGAAEPAGLRFYAEFAVNVEPEADDPIARLISEPASPSVLRWWYSAGLDEVGRWRWEIENTAPTIDGGTSTSVFDGTHQWEYDDRSLRYRRSEPFELPAGLVLSPSFGAPVGPANVPDIDAFIEQWQLRSPDGDIRRAGEETVLGRRTEVIEIRPAWTGATSSGSAEAGSDSGSATSRSQDTDTSGGVIRVSIDPERMFIMRWATEGGAGNQSYAIEATRLDYDQPIDEAVLSFAPPPDAIEATQADDTQSCETHLGAGPGFTAPPGFLSTAYSPTGYTSGASTAESGSGCSTAAVSALAENDTGGYVLLRQRVRPAGIPESLRAGTTVEINGQTGYLSDAGGVTRLIWTDGDVAAELITNDLLAGELIRIAESTQITPENNHR